MCEFCEKHGHGSRWFLNPDNFSDELMRDRGRRKLVEQICGYNIDYYVDFTSKITGLTHIPVLGSLVRGITERLAPGMHGGQVVSLEDALDIASLAKNLVLIPCACRRLVAHGDDMACLNFGPIRDMQRAALPDGPMEELTTEEAREVLKLYDRKGRIHQVLYAKLPFPVVLCNCSTQWCTSFKQRMANGVRGAVMKGHDVCQVDRQLCDGCGGEAPCVERCAFGALSYDREGEMVRLDPGKCFGCGLCRDFCEPQALAMIPRAGIPEIARSW